MLILLHFDSQLGDYNWINSISSTNDYKYSDILIILIKQIQLKSLFINRFNFIVICNYSIFKITEIIIKNSESQ